MKITIKKGRHYCSIPIWKRFWPTNKDIDCEFSIDSNNWYEKLTPDSPDHNKLCGRTYGFNVHNNSIRTVWNPNFMKRNEFIIKEYIYEDGIKREKDACTIVGDKKYRITIKHMETPLTLTGLKKLVIYDGVVRIYSSTIFLETNKMGFKCWPYFGGDDKAYWDMLFTLKYR